MALFIDGPVSSIEDLADQDSQLLDVANVEAIDVTLKLRLAQDELAVELGPMLSRLISVSSRWSMSTGIGIPPKIRNVVVTPPLKLWHTFRALEMVYRDAYANQLNARYTAKRDQFHERVKWAYENLILSGIGVVWDPVPRAATPDVVTASGNLGDGTYYVTMAWLNGAGEEGDCAAPAVIGIAGSTLLVRPGNAPQNAAGWNVYVGRSQDAMALQNGSPAATAQTWLQPSPLSTTGRAPGPGQSPTYMRPVPRAIQRG